MTDHPLPALSSLPSDELVEVFRRARPNMPRPPLDKYDFANLLDLNEPRDNALTARLEAEYLDQADAALTASLRAVIAERGAPKTL